MDDRAAIIWRRLDAPGHDAAELSRRAGGWQLSGAAVFVQSALPCRMDYLIACDSEWRTERCVVTGHAGGTAVALDIARDSHGRWTSGGTPLSPLDGCIDIDLGFTPATNALPIRRLTLDVGTTAAVRAAWVRFPELTIEVLEQTYSRIAPDRYRYESGGGSFRRELVVDKSGFVLEYPGLWTVEAFSSGESPGSR